MFSPLSDSQYLPRMLAVLSFLLSLPTRAAGIPQICGFLDGLELPWAARGAEGSHFGSIPTQPNLRGPLQRGTQEAKTLWF
jgi:hypothetical protein